MKLTNDLRMLEVGSLRILHDLGPTPRLVFDAEGIQGLEDTADIAREIVKRPTSHGDFPEPARYQSKVYTITGAALAGSPAELHTLRDQMAGAFAVGMAQWVKVSNTSGTRWLHASQGSKLEWLQRDDTKAAWKLDLYTADPRMYGEELSAQITSAGTNGAGLSYELSYPLSFGVTTSHQQSILQNVGNIEAWASFTVTGDYPAGFTLRESASGREVAYSGPVTMASPVTIDFFRGAATTNGVDRSYMLTKRQWFPIPRGGAIQPLFIPVQEGNGWVDATWRATWV